MKRILVVFTGGTIGSAVVENAIDVNEDWGNRLIESYNRTAETAVEFVTKQPFCLLSENLQPSHLEKLCETLRETLFSAYDGIIVTHGTDTLSYTSAMLGFVFAGIPIPLVITGSTYPLSDPRSDAQDNFRGCVHFILHAALHGVFTVFRNRQKEMVVYLPTRICEADPYLDQFSSIGACDFGKMRGEEFVWNDSPGNPALAAVNAQEYSSSLPVSLKETIPILHAYPGLRYDQVSLSAHPKAILQLLYHSGTGCVTKGAYSLIDFLKRCRACGTDVYVLSVKPAGNPMYVTSIALLEQGAIPLFGMSREAAYAKLHLAYAQRQYEPSVFMQTELSFEFFRS